MADDGSVCLVAHEETSAQHPRNPLCPLLATGRRPTPGPPARSAAPTASSASCAWSEPAPPFTDQERNLLGALADMAAIAVRTARLHEAEEQWTIHAERDRIARELHDSLAQVLGVIHLQLRSLEARAKDEAEPRHRRRALRPRRDRRRGLQGRPRGDPRPARDGPRGRRPGGLAARVPAQVQPPDGHRRHPHLRGRHPPRAQPAVRGPAAAGRPGGADQHAQALAGASGSPCASTASAPGTTLTIEDDGVGFDPSTVASSMDGGFGMASMRERVEQIGGSIDVHTAPNEGTTIVVRLDAEDTRGTPSAETPGAARR